MRSSLAHSLAVIVAALVIAPAASAETWYAAPGGIGDACTALQPCSANYATTTKAQDDDTVVFAGGDYPITTGIEPTNWISLEGAKTGVPTRFIGGPGVIATLEHSTASTLTSAHITDLRVTNQATSGYAVYANASGVAGLIVDRVAGEATGGNGIGLAAAQSSSAIGLVLARNSIGRATGTGGIGMLVSGPIDGTGSAEIRNIVADSRGPSGVGLRVAGSGGAVTCGDFNVVMKNSIARSATGPISDLSFAAGFGAAPCDATLASHNSNWRAATTSLTIDSINDQHSVDPLFANAAGGDYSQLAGSPTIDAGVNDSLIGPGDFDNRARVFGAAPDIGAFEYQPPVPPADTSAPTGSKLKLSPKSFLPKASKQVSVTAKKKKKPKGTTATFTLSEAATVKFTVQRKSTGRKKGKSCSTKRKTGKKCTIYKTVKGSFTRASTAGANSFKFTGYVNGKALKPGSYRLVGLPTDAAGNAGASFTSSFTILKR